MIDRPDVSASTAADSGRVADASALVPVRDDARGSIEVGRQRALDVDRALAELRANLRAAPRPDATVHTNADGTRRAELEPAAAYRWLLLDGHEAFCRGRFSDALSTFEQAAREGPRRIEGHLNVGRTLLRMRRFAEAREAFSRAVALEPDHAAARAGLADSAWRLELPEIEPEPAPRPASRFRRPASRSNRRANRPN
jgi:tetratricopeptide (TPR) repeat protein